MKTSDLVAETLREGESGKTWEERITAATGSIEVPKLSAVRVRAGSGSTVTIDGILAATMATGEVIIFNAGDGDPDSGKPTVTIAIGVAAAWVQVAREVHRKTLIVNTYNNL